MLFGAGEGELSLSHLSNESSWSWSPGGIHSPGLITDTCEVSQLWVAGGAEERLCHPVGRNGALRLQDQDSGI